MFGCASNIISEPGSRYSFAIIFFDEFDAIAGKRGDDPSMLRTVNTLLQAMDGIKSNPNVSVLAATNYPWSLDDAILRRFTTRIFVDLPDPIAIEFLVRQELADVYSNPNATRQQKMASIRNKSGRYIQDAQYIKNIRIYGAYRPDVQAAGYFSAAKSTDRPVDDEYITKLVGLFGPTAVGKKIIDEVKSGKDVKSDDPRLDTPTHIFGFSPSDITKIIQEAVKHAAVRALQEERAEKKEVEGWGKAYWITVRGNVGLPTKNVPEDERDLVINFDIRQSDVEQSIKNLPSTIDNYKYLELLRYAKLG